MPGEESARPPGRRSNVDVGLLEARPAADSNPIELIGLNVAGAIGGIGFSNSDGLDGGGGLDSPPPRPKLEGMEGLGGGPDIVS